MTIRSNKFIHLLYLMLFLLSSSLILIYKSFKSTGKQLKLELARNQTEILRLNKMLVELKTNKEQVTKELKKKGETFERDTKTRHLLERQLERQAALRAFCLKQNKISSRIDQNIFYDDKHNFIYCAIPKAACTNWKRIMLVLNGQFKYVMEEKDKDKVHKYKIKQLRDVKKDEFTRKRNTYYSFLFVRDPFERLVASYRNKLHDPYNRGFQLRYGPKILKLYRKNLTKSEYDEGKGVTFREFIDWVILKKDKEGFDSLDEHWQLMHRIANPCMLKYDFIGKMETLYDDADQVLKELNLTQAIQFPKKFADKYKAKSENLITKYFSTVPKKTLGKLHDIYKDDFEAFGYKKPDYLKNLSFAV